MANLLIVEDDLDSADALSLIMQSEGHEIRVGYNGAEGLRLAEEWHPDLVLLDVEMPILNGPDMSLAMLIHNMGLELIPVILLSGVPDLDRIGKEVGTPYFLGKPYHLAQIVALVDRALAERQPPRRAVMR